ncbi:MAG: serine/threonine-protein kinase, partial [Planctomycetota bacterium]
KPLVSESLEKPLVSESLEKPLVSESLETGIESKKENVLLEKLLTHSQTLTWEEAENFSQTQKVLSLEEVTQFSESLNANAESITYVSSQVEEDPNRTRNIDFKAEMLNVSVSSVENRIQETPEDDGKTRAADWDDGQTKVADLENDVTKIAGQQVARPSDPLSQDQKDTSSALLSPNEISKVQNQFESEVDSIIDINKKRTRPIIELETLVGETLIEQTLLKVEAKIAEGGMGTIYRAKMVFADGVEKAVALKTLKSQYTQNPELLSMFINEARLMAELTHHNVVTMLTFGKFQGLYFYAMEYVEGRDLNEFHARHKKLNRATPLGHICYIISQVCAALFYIHNKKDNRGKPLELIHRDISPHNIMFSKDGVVKLMDFGVAKGKSIAKSQSKPFAGKLNYIAPEMALSKEVDHRSDIYSLGIVFYEVLTGQLPLRWRNHVDLIFGIEKAEIKPPISIRSDIP